MLRLFLLLAALALARGFGQFEHFTHAHEDDIVDVSPFGSLLPLRADVNEVTAPGDPACTSTQAGLEWSAQGNAIYVNGKFAQLKVSTRMNVCPTLSTFSQEFICSLFFAIHIQGISWSGLETPSMLLSDATISIPAIVSKLAEYGFNTIRVPFSAEWALSDIKGAGWTELDELFQEAANSGLVVLLALQNLNATRPGNTLWYDDVYSEEDVMRLYIKVLQR